MEFEGIPKPAELEIDYTPPDQPWMETPTVFKPGTYGSDPGYVVGEVHLQGGQIYCTSLILHAGGHIYVGEGQLLLDGIQTTLAQQYVDNGWITAYGSSEPRDVLVKYDSVTGKTIVRKATAEDKGRAWNPRPTNGQQDASGTSVGGVTSVRQLRRSTA